MSEYDALCKAIGTLARSMRALQQQAARQYQPVVDDILRTRSRDIRHIDPAATAYYINAYREY